MFLNDCMLNTENIIQFFFSGDVAEDSKNRRADLFVQILKDEAVGRLNELGKVPDHDSIFSSLC